MGENGDGEVLVSCHGSWGKLKKKIKNGKEEMGGSGRVGVRKEREEKKM